MKRVSVRAIMRDQQDNICLIHRVKDGDEYWVVPGGGVEDGEDFITAVKREMMEEIGSAIMLDDETPVFSIDNGDQTQHFYTCHEVSRIKPTGEEHKKHTPENQYNIVFLSVKEMSAIKLVPEQIKEKIIRHANESIGKPE